MKIDTVSHTKMVKINTLLSTQKPCSVCPPLPGLNCERNLKVGRNCIKIPRICETITIWKLTKGIHKIKQVYSFIDGKRFSNKSFYRRLTPEFSFEALLNLAPIKVNKLETY